ncbi:MAG: hypothetical protein GF408_06985 [Candidatus Omnitrophica bacterium]|nr:hypothetical protein [Candidatus Omnitrophota bacterium]
MGEAKTKAIKNIEGIMETVEEGTLRRDVLEHARTFKTSWIDLGRALFTVWKEKMYKQWGYDEFQAYASKEIGIRKETAHKLLRSYSFMEQKEPAYIKKDYTEKAEAAKVPTYEAVDVLRQASKKDLDSEEYSSIRQYVLKDGKDARDVKKDLTRIIKQREETDPEEVRAQKRIASLKRMVSLLKSVSKELKHNDLLKESTLKQIGQVIASLEKELPGEGKLDF